MWNVFFKNPDVWGMDNFWGRNLFDKLDDIKLLTNDFQTTFIYGDLSSNDDWNEIELLCKEDVDFFIDDGSHFPQHILYTLWKTINIIKPNGYYFIEDLQSKQTCGNWGYNNCQITESLLNWLKDGTLKSDFISTEQCLEIQSTYTLCDVVLDPNNMNYIAILNKK